MEKSLEKRELVSENSEDLKELFSKRLYTTYFTKNTKDDFIKLTIIFNKKENKDVLNYEIESVNNKRVKIIKNKNDVLKRVLEFGLAVVNLKSEYLDLENQFDGKIYKPDIKHILNESITLNVFKITNKIKIKNSLTIYGFINTTSKDMLILVNRQFFDNNKKIVRSHCILIQD